MNKQIKQMKIMLVVLVGVVFCIGAVVLYNKSVADGEAADEAQKVLCEIDASEVTAFSYVLDSETLSFTLDDDTWYYDNDSSLSIDSDAIEEMLDAVASVSYVEKVEDAEDVSSYGLDEPTNVISITTDDAIYTFTIGNKNELTYDYYMLFGDDDTVYTVSSDLTNAFASSVDDLLETASE